MKKPIFSIAICIFSCLLLGCSIQPLRIAVVNGNNLENRPGAALINPKDTSDSAKYIDNWNWNNGGKIKSDDVKQLDSCRVGFHPSYYQNRWMVVEGKLGSGKKYPIILDTGASLALSVNDIHVLENNIPVYPLPNYDNSAPDSGLCYLPKLNIGQVNLSDWPCYFQNQHTELQVFGLPIQRNNAIIAGLAALRKFKYIAFDSVHKEVEFSLNRVFKPSQYTSWAQYSFVIEEDIGGNSFLFVKIPIAGQETQLQLDTGSGRGLAIAEKLWEEIGGKIKSPSFNKANDLYPYIGWLTCLRGVVPKVQIGNRTVNNAEISVFPNDCPLVDQCQGLIGMQYFRDTVLVLDFERNLMWVKNT